MKPLVENFTNVRQPDIVRVVSCIFLLSAMLFRFCYVAGPIDSFSAWRQAETAYMTLRMYEESPPEIMHSKVPYRGAKDVHLAEFPVQPLITAYIYKMIGQESLLMARLVTLLFFCSGLALLFLLARRFLGSSVAWIGIAVYSWVPLGIGYSRAVHVDFCILAFSYAYLYFAIRFFDTRRWWLWFLSCFAATIAFAMKAPYCFYLGLPLLIYVGSRPRDRNVRSFLLVCALFVLPLCAALAFNWHRMALEAGEEESLVYCMKWTPELGRSQFFGSMQQRFEWVRWKEVFRRVWFWVLTPVGGLLALLGIGYKPPKQSWRGVAAVYAWYVGILVYALTVFPIFSSVHDYYSLPLLAPAAMAVALGIIRVINRIQHGWIKGAVLIVLLACVAVSSLRVLYRSERFTVDHQRIQAGKLIRQHSQPSDLVLSVTEGRSTGWSDPRILYYAGRRGWAIELDQLDLPALTLYRTHGLQNVALLVAPTHWPLEPEKLGVLKDFSGRTFTLSDPHGKPVGYLVFYEIKSLEPSSINL